MADHRTGKSNPRRPEKTEHLPYINDALTDALNKWQDGDPTEVDVILQASISPNPGGIGQYRVIIKRQSQTFLDE